MIVCIYDEHDDVVEIDVPSKKEVCYNCNGEGTHIHNAFREESFTVYDAEREGLDFEEEVRAMQSGMYDVVCETCSGKRVLDAPDFSQISKELSDKIREYEKCQAEYEAEARAERMMEARMLGYGYY